jgi:hypothetical protein
VLAGVLVAACSDGDAFDREAAVAAVAEDRGWTEKEAGCWVDRVRDDLGDEELAAALAGDTDAAAFADITVDCVDPAKLATRPDLQTTVTARPDEPFTYGDDAELDALWDGCAAGDGAMCDTLFDTAPLGSDYERFGSTCGDRGVAPRCAG